MLRPMADQQYDVVVVGGGPAGMMAAGRAAERGARVLLLEKNAGLGKKLLITGGGRCNICNAEFNTHLLTAKYGRKGKALFSTFAQFDVQATMDFFTQRGLPIKVEAEQRAFPVSDKAEDVQKLMIAYLREHGVTVQAYSPVRGIKAEGERIAAITLDDHEVVASQYIVATGGKSRPETGSTGDGFVWLKKLGHTIVEPDPALVPITLKDPWVEQLSGISLLGVQLTAYQAQAKQAVLKGKMLFTHTGLSGPLVLNMSKTIGELLKEGPVELRLDLFPGEDLGALDVRVLAHFERGKNKMLKNHIGDLVQPRLGHILLALANLNGDTPLHQLTRDQRLDFVRILKAMPMHVAGLLGADKAIVTGGGVLLSEVDFKTMRSKLYKNLWLAGDILDFDRPSGGFSLQICWSTGWVAGTAAAEAKSA